MEKWLKRIVIICMIGVIVIALLDIYNDFLLPKLYDGSTECIAVNDEKEYELCNNAVFKYITSVSEDIKNIKYFIPSINRNKESNQRYENNLKDLYEIKTYNLYKIKNNVYKIEYTIFQNREKKYNMIINFNPKRNYYSVLYDELYLNGR